MSQQPDDDVINGGPRAPAGFISYDEKGVGLLVSTVNQIPIDHKDDVLIYDTDTGLKLDYTITHLSHNHTYLIVADKSIFSTPVLHSSLLHDLVIPSVTLPPHPDTPKLVDMRMPNLPPIRAPMMMSIKGFAHEFLERSDQASVFLEDIHLRHAACRASVRGQARMTKAVDKIVDEMAARVLRNHVTAHDFREKFTAQVELWQDTLQKFHETLNELRAIELAPSLRSHNKGGPCQDGSTSPPPENNNEDNSLRSWLPVDISRLADNCQVKLEALRDHEAESLDIISSIFSHYDDVIKVRAEHNQPATGISVVEARVNDLGIIAQGADNSYVVLSNASSNICTYLEDNHDKNPDMEQVSRWVAVDHQGNLEIKQMFTWSEEALSITEICEASRMSVTSWALQQILGHVDSHSTLLPKWETRQKQIENLFSFLGQLFGDLEAILELRANYSLMVAEIDRRTQWRACRLDECSAIATRLENERFDEMQSRLRHMSVVQRIGGRYMPQDVLAGMTVMPSLTTISTPDFDQRWTGLDDIVQRFPDSANGPPLLPEEEVVTLRAKLIGQEQEIAALRAALEASRTTIHNMQTADVALSHLTSSRQRRPRSFRRGSVAGTSASSSLSPSSSNSASNNNNSMDDGVLISRDDDRPPRPAFVSEGELFNKLIEFPLSIVPNLGSDKPYIFQKVETSKICTYRACLVLSDQILIASADVYDSIDDDLLPLFFIGRLVRVLYQGQVGQNMQEPGFTEGLPMGTEWVLGRIEHLAGLPLDA